MFIRLAHGAGRDAGGSCWACWSHRREAPTSRPAGQISRTMVDTVVLDPAALGVRAETTPLRAALRETIGSMADRSGAPTDGPPGPLVTNGVAETAYYRIWGLVPQNPVQRALQSRAIQIATDLAQTRLLLFAQPVDAISTPFLLVLVLWLKLIFTSFSIFAPPKRDGRHRPVRLPPVGIERHLPDPGGWAVHSMGLLQISSGSPAQRPRPPTEVRTR